MTIKEVQCPEYPKGNCKITTCKVTQKVRNIIICTKAKIWIWNIFTPADYYFDSLIEPLKAIHWLFITQIAHWNIG